MRRGGSLSENLRTKFYGSIYQHQFGYTLNLLPSCLKNGGHLSGIMERNLRWVIDADLSNYFGSISHTHLRGFLDLRITDGVVRRMIDKWLKAGVLEEGVLRRSETGTPQGGVISPTLSNIFLHHVLDEWFEREAKPRLSGECELVRFADDFVLAFKDAQSGGRMLNVLGKRLARYGLTLHETKTRYVDFRPKRPRTHSPDKMFDFLGFTHVWGRSQNGWSVVRQITAKGRFTRAIKVVNAWCKANRHRPLQEQHQHLARVIRGHCNYYGLTGNSRRLGGFRYWVIRYWRKALARRTRAGRVTWNRMTALLNRHPLPPATVAHSIYAK